MKTVLLCLINPLFEYDEMMTILTHGQVEMIWHWLYHLLLFFKSAFYSTTIIQNKIYPDKSPHWGM